MRRPLALLLLSACLTVTWWVTPAPGPRAAPVTATAFAPVVHFAPVPTTSLPPRPLSPTPVGTSGVSLVATPTTIPASLSSGMGDLLAQQSAYVRQAFACIEGIESNGEPTVVNPSSGDGGLFQFNVGTWLASGGAQFSPRAELATVAEQDTVAVWTWERDGFGPWTGDNRCWE